MMVAQDGMYLFYSLKNPWSLWIYQKKRNGFVFNPDYTLNLLNAFNCKYIFTSLNRSVFEI